MANDAALEDLRHLAKIKGGATIRRNLKPRRALVQHILGTLKLGLAPDDDHGADLLEAVLPGVAAGARRTALDQLAKTGNVRDSPSFQVAAASELLSLTDEDQFAEALNQYWKYIGKTPAAQEQLRRQLTENLRSFSPTRRRQLRAAVWILRTDRNVRTPSVHDELLRAFLDEIAVYLRSDQVRQRARDIATSHVKQLESSGPSVGMPASSKNLERLTIDPDRRPIPLAPSAARKHEQHQLGRLADGVRRQWGDEQRRRRESDHFLLSVHWKNAPKQYADHWANISRRSTNDDAIVLDGQLDAAVQVFESIPSQRLVVLGQGGAGKTTLVIELALELLDRRSVRDPVPVIFSLTSWDPTRQSLRDWISSRLVHEYKEPMRNQHADTEARFAQLTRSNLILPVLDGFDEMYPELRTTAIRAFNSYDGSLVVSSRTQPYYDTIDTGGVVLRGAAAIVLQDLALDAVSRYLPLTARPSADMDEVRSKWDPILEQMALAPEASQGAVLNRVFVTPLMVSLARRIYSDTSADPAELLDEHRFPHAYALSSYLFDQLVRVAYDHPVDDQGPKQYRSWSLNDAQYWLKCYATYLHGRRHRGVRRLRGDVINRRSTNILTRRIITEGQPERRGWRISWRAVANIFRDIRFPSLSIEFLEDASRRGILRKSGHDWEFKHSLLRDRLAYLALSEPARDIGSPTLRARAMKVLAIDMFQRGLFDLAEPLLRESEELSGNMPLRRDGPLKRGRASWEIKQVEDRVMWKMQIDPGSRSSGTIFRCPSSPGDYFYS